LAPLHTIGGDPGHERVGVMHALSAAEIEGKRDRVSEVLRVGFRRRASPDDSWVVSKN